MIKKLKDGDDIKAVIKAAFGVELPISGGWGYEKTNPIIIETSSISATQVEYMFANMRAVLELSITQKEENRYGGININELKRETVDGFDKVIYEVTAIKEDIYKELINEYKEGYGKDEFDIDAHFKKREEFTYKKEVGYWFKLN